MLSRTYSLMDNVLEWSGCQETIQVEKYRSTEVVKNMMVLVMFLAFIQLMQIIYRIIESYTYYLAKAEKLDKNPNCRQNFNYISLFWILFNTHILHIRSVYDNQYRIFYYIIYFRALLYPKGLVRYHSGGSMKLNACNLLLTHMVYL